MNTGLDTTFEVLTKSRNEAAGAALLACLDNSDDKVFNETLQALLARRKKSGHLEFLKRWHQLTDVQRSYIQEARGRMSGALRDAILTQEEQLFANACQVVEQLSDFDIIPTLVTLVENQKSNHVKAATALMQKLVAQLSEWVHGARDESENRDPKAFQRFVLESLERSVERFRQHQKPEIIDSFVILGGPTSTLLSKILDDPHHACYLTVINTLTTSSSTVVIDMLLNALHCESTSLGLLNVISKRNDKKFIDQLLDLSSDSIPPTVTKNLARINSFAWLQPSDYSFEQFSEADKARSIKLAAASDIKQSKLLELINNVLQGSKSENRFVAAEALMSIRGSKADEILMDLLYDEDPNLQAMCVRQLRERQLAGTKSILIKMVDSLHEVVREAAREALSEFTFSNFLVGYDSMNGDARRLTAMLVRKVDLEIAPGIISELESNAGRRRIRAIEMAHLLDVVPDVADKLIERLKDEDHMVRTAAATTLQYHLTPETQEALQQATQDTSATVQNAARISLSAFANLNLPTNSLYPMEGTP